MPAQTHSTHSQFQGGRSNPVRISASVPHARCVVLLHISHLHIGRASVYTQDCRHLSVVWPTACCRREFLPLLLADLSVLLPREIRGGRSFGVAACTVSGCRHGSILSPEHSVAFCRSTPTRIGAAGGLRLAACHITCLAINGWNASATLPLSQGRQ